MGQKTQVSSCQQTGGIFFKGCVFGLKLRPTVTVLRMETLGDDLTPAKGGGRRSSVIFVLLILLYDITSPPSWKMQPLDTILDAEAFSSLAFHPGRNTLCPL